MGKRGLSGVVVVVLLILIAIVLVSLIWVVVNNLVLDTGTNILSKKGSIDLDLQIVAEGLVINETAKTVFFKVKRGPGEGELSGLRIILQDTLEREELFSVNLSLKELEVKPIFVDYSMSKLGNLSRISIAPVFLVKRVGRNDFVEVVGAISATRAVSGGGGGGDNPPGGGNTTGISWPPNYPEKSMIAYEWKYDCNTNNCIQNGAGTIKYPNAQVDNLASFFWLHDSNPNTQVSEAVSFMSNVPVGMRALFSWSVHTPLFSTSSDFCSAFNPESGQQEDFTCLWWDDGVQQTYNYFDAFTRNYKNAGGNLDVLVLDIEVGLSNWANGRAGSANWSDRGSQWHNNKWQKMEEHGRFASEGIKDELVNRGYYSPNYPPEFLHLNDTVWQHSQNAMPQPEAYDNFLVWNDLMHDRVMAYKESAIYEAVRNNFLGFNASEWDARYWNTSYAIPDINGVEHEKYGDGAIVGTHQALGIYGKLRDITRTGRGPGGITYVGSPFNAFRYDANRLRGAYLASSETPLSVWVAWRSRNDLNVYYVNNDYYYEAIFHAGLANTDYFLYWNPYSPAGGVQEVLFSNALHELDELTGYDVQKNPIIDGLSSWTNQHVYTGMAVGDFKVWRFTPNSIGVVVNEDENGVSFVVNDTEILFPEGVIYQSSNSVSSAGYWVLQDLSAQDPVEIQGLLAPPLNQTLNDTNISLAPLVPPVSIVPGGGLGNLPEEDVDVRSKFKRSSGGSGVSASDSSGPATSLVSKVIHLYESEEETFREVSVFVLLFLVFGALIFFIVNIRRLRKKRVVSLWIAHRLR